jgi:ankyrin repeat protein
MFNFFNIPEGEIFPINLERPVEPRLHQLIKQGSLAKSNIEQHLLEHPEDINQPSSSHDTPLHVAIKRGYTDIAVLLLQYGADPTLTTNYNSLPLLEGNNHIAESLHLSLYYQNETLVEYFIDLETDLHCHTRPVISAILASFNRSDATRELLTQRLLQESSALLVTPPHPMSRYPTLIHQDIWNGEKNLLKYLIKAHNDYGSVDDYDLPEAEMGRTPLLLAAVLNSSFDVCQQIYHAGYRVDAIDAAGNSVIHYLSQPRVIDCMGGVANRKFDYFIDKVPQEYLSRPNRTGKTPLHFTAQLQDSTFLQSLLQRGVDTMIADNDGYYAIHHAVSRGHVLNVITLINAEPKLLNIQIVQSREEPVPPAPVTLPTEETDLLTGSTPLHFAVEHYNNVSQYVTATKLLMISAPGHRVPETSYDHTTDYLYNIDIAAKIRSVLEVLLEHGADTTLRNSQGKTAEDVAVDRGLYDIVQTFRNHSEQQKRLSGQLIVLR